MKKLKQEACPETVTRILKQYNYNDKHQQA
jgi:hypothetical protein